MIDHAGVVRWMNEAGRRIVGDQVGRQFTSVVVDMQGRHIAVEISSVPLRRGEHVIGVFGHQRDGLRVTTPWQTDRRCLSRR